MELQGTFTAAQPTSNSEAIACMARFFQRATGGNHWLAADLLKKESAGLLAGKKISEEERKKIFHECAAHLMNKGDIGMAKDLLENLAKCYCCVGNLNDAIDVYVSFADELFNKCDFGWAGERYYKAATLSIEQGDLGKALEILREARDRYANHPIARHDGWMRLLMPNVDELKTACSQPFNIPEEDKYNRMLDAISILRSDFVEISQNDWIRSCDEGISRIISTMQERAKEAVE